MSCLVIVSSLSSEVCKQVPLIHASKLTYRMQGTELSAGGTEENETQWGNKDFNK